MTINALDKKLPDPSEVKKLAVDGTQVSDWYARPGFGFLLLDRDDPKATYWTFTAHAIDGSEPDLRCSLLSGDGSALRLACP